ncbi:hypothetical protein FUA23_19325 [Neolewinella aurantiaca]|uniref:Uncharacterized protein n=1 Tax=Neolewinella aurantiaca TaxID=2602767 RepID=A0A5C7FH68_9BACT|nr:hypothetical protein [Neolewinella aurantiaca]TXF86657.1 hypothetical protein FUA23_19325 [Neolewinella aurantiaca]
MPTNYTEEDLVYVRLIRREIGNLWSEARQRVIDNLPEGSDPELIGKYVDERPEPGIYINEYGVEPRFYPHRTSGRLLEFYRSV